MAAFTRIMATGLQEVDFDPNGAEGDFSEQKFYSAVAGAMSVHGVSWCDQCRVLALHTPGINDPMNMPIHDVFTACTTAEFMPLALGADSGRHMGATSAVTPLRSAPERPRLDLEATLAQGDSFGRMLERAGVGAGEADLIAEMVSREMPLSEIEPGTKVDITLGRRPAPGANRPLDALSFRARFDLQLAVEWR